MSTKVYLPASIYMLENRLDVAIKDRDPVAIDRLARKLQKRLITTVNADLPEDSLALAQEKLGAINDYINLFLDVD